MECVRELVLVKMEQAGSEVQVVGAERVGLRNVTFEPILEERVCHVTSWWRSFPGANALWPSRNRKIKASREVKERSTDEKVKSGIIKGPEGHCRHHSFYSDRNWLLESLEKRQALI